MSPAIFINLPPIFSKFPKFNNIHSGTPLKGSSIDYRKSVRLGKTMAAGSTETGIGGGDVHISPAVSAFEQEALIDNGGDVSFHQTAGGLHALLNRLSKWVVAVTFGGLIILRHDALALWGAMGSVLNVILSKALKKILKQERPVAGVSSGHGMPSSHAQSIFFATIFLIISVIQWQGLNGVAAILSVLLLMLGSYLSWLRVLERYHSNIQVVVGAIVGSVFSVVWLWAWEASVVKAYESSLWVKILVIGGSVCFCVGFISHVFRNWLKEDH